MLEFKDAKRITLLALYNYLLRGRGDEWLAPEQVNRSVSKGFSILYLKKVLSSLEEENLVDCQTREDFVFFSISEQGILTVEQTLLPKEEVATDRIIATRDLPEIDTLQRQLAELAEKLRTANDVGSLSEEQRLAASNEVTQLSNTIADTHVRLSTLRSMSKHTLTWIAEAAGEAVVGSLAAAALAALAMHFGFST